MGALSLPQSSIDSPVRTNLRAAAYQRARLVDTCVRSVYLALGVTLTIVGLLAVVLPVAPAVSTLLASTYFLNRSHPGLQYWLNNRPVIGRVFKYLDGSHPMTVATRNGFVIYLWGNLLLSCACLSGIGLASSAIVSINIFCCLLSTLFLLKFRALPAKVTKTISVEQCGAVPEMATEAHVLEAVRDLSPGQTDTSSVPRCNALSVGLPHTTGMTGPRAD